MVQIQVKKEVPLPRMKITLWEFYHGYYQDESEWAAAQVMRYIYDQFAEEHADGECDIQSNSGGES